MKAVGITAIFSGMSACPAVPSGGLGKSPNPQKTCPCPRAQRASLGWASLKTGMDPLETLGISHVVDVPVPNSTEAAKSLI